MNFLEKIRGLSERERKIILWLAMVILAIFLSVWYVRSVKQKINSLNKEEFIKSLNLPDLGKELNELPNVEMSKTESSGSQPETTTSIVGSQGTEPSEAPPENATRTPAQEESNASATEKNLFENQ
jgi:hypothetical protein